MFTARTCGTNEFSIGHQRAHECAMGRRNENFRDNFLLRFVEFLSQFQIKRFAYLQNEKKIHRMENRWDAETALGSMRNDFHHAISPVCFFFMQNVTKRTTMTRVNRWTEQYIPRYAFIAWRKNIFSSAQCLENVEQRNQFNKNRLSGIWNLEQYVFVYIHAMHNIRVQMARTVKSSVRYT